MFNWEKKSGAQNQVKSLIPHKKKKQKKKPRNFHFKNKAWCAFKKKITAYRNRQI